MPKSLGTTRLTKGAGKRSGEVAVCTLSHPSPFNLGKYVLKNKTSSFDHVSLSSTVSQTRKHIYFLPTARGEGGWVESIYFLFFWKFTCCDIRKGYVHSGLFECIMLFLKQTDQSDFLLFLMWAAKLSSNPYNKLQSRGIKWCRTRDFRVVWGKTFHCTSSFSKPLFHVSGWSTIIRERETQVLGP